MEIKLMLNNLIFERQFFSLDMLNSRIQNFTYGKAEARNKPPKSIDATHITSSGTRLCFSGI